MPGQQSKRARTKEAASLRAAYPEDLADAHAKIAAYLPEGLDNIIQLARGYERKYVNKKGEEGVIKEPPSQRANEYLVNRFLGVPATEPDRISDQLRMMQSALIGLQIKHNLPEAQRVELEARAQIKQIEAQMWPQQFVTEEQELANIQAVAAATNRKLLSMTPEEFEEIIKGKNPADALEEFKGRIGVSQADVVAEVMQYREGAVSDEDEEEEEDG